MYNSVYPVNINYTKPNQYRNDNENNFDAKNSHDTQNNTNTFPNGTKVAVDYTKGQINISQVLTDFKSTLIAINAPSEVQDEVSLYLSLVDKESKKETPSKDIIKSNLKNAAKLSDSFITVSLKKQSNVVEGWIDALFLQKINLKSNPDEINPDFLLDFPKNAQERINNAKITEADKTLQKEETKKIELDENIAKNDEIVFVEDVQDIKNENIDDKNIDNSLNNIEVKNELELSDYTPSSPFQAINEIDNVAKNILIQIKNLPNTNEGDTQALNLLNETLGDIGKYGDCNPNLKAALHFERGRIFDNYDYVDYALRDYYEATKADELNLKAKAYYKSGSIYDEFSEFAPALDEYLSSVAYSGEADNIKAQTLVLSKIASLYTKQYNSDMVSEYDTLATQSANSTENYELIAQTYSNSAQNYQYLGENSKAINSYKYALKAFSQKDESYDDMAYNYEQAAIVMKKLGNSAKADKLQAKAQLYYQKAQLEHEQLAKVS